MFLARNDHSKYFADPISFIAKSRPAMETKLPFHLKYVPPGFLCSLSLFYLNASLGTYWLSLWLSIGDLWLVFLTFILNSTDCFGWLLPNLACLSQVLDPNAYVYICHIVSPVKATQVVYNYSCWAVSWIAGWLPYLCCCSVFCFCFVFFLKSKWFVGSCGDG